MSTTMSDDTVATKSLDERKGLLARAVANEIRQNRPDYGPRQVLESRA